MGREKRTILIVDGSSTMVFYLGMLLKRLEYAVLSARTGEDALKTLARGLPSAVLTDVALPAMSGIELLRAIKNSEQFKHLPVIVLCSDWNQALKANCISMGCAAFLNKPVEPDDLYRTLQAAMEATPRNTIRLNTSLPVIVGDGSASGGAVRTEYASAISEGGLFIRTLYPQPRNAVTPLKITIADRDISVQAAVIYVYAVNEGPDKEPGMGMKFTEIADDDRLRIREFIKEQLTKDIGS